MILPSAIRQSRGSAIPHILLPLILTVFLAGCASTPVRPPVTSAQQNAAVIPGYDDIRFVMDASNRAWDDWAARMRVHRAGSAMGDRVDILAVSSGADQGAFGAGYLLGWSERGDRPRFDIVTGVSTGALIAPFAFLGSEYDPSLEQLYTQTSAQGLYRLSILSGLLGSPSIADNSPMRAIIARHVTPEFVDRIADEHRQGRRLLVLTTNLDSQEGIVWDIGAIANSNADSRVNLIRQVILASASIPGLLPPAMIGVEAHGQAFEEMHVDGAVSASSLLVPLSALTPEPAGSFETGNGSVTLLYNNVVWPRYEVTEPSTFAIMIRSLDTNIAAADRSMLRDYAASTEAAGYRFNVLSIGEDYEIVDHARFDEAFMRSLFAYGRARAADAFIQ